MTDKILGYMIVRDEIDIIKEVIEYYAWINSPIIIFDNGSTDGTLDVLRSFERSGRVKIVECPTEKYDLRSLLLSAVQTAQQLTSDWILHIDADHFYDPPKGMSSLTAMVEAADCRGANVINFAEYTFYPTARDVDSESSVQRRIRFFRRGVGQLQQPRLFKSVAGVENHLDGGHSISFPDREVIWSQDEGILRHYPFRSIEHIKRKIRARLARYSDAGLQRNWHQQYQSTQLSDWYFDRPEEQGLSYWPLSELTVEDVE